MVTSYGFITDKTKSEGKIYLYSDSEIIFCLYNQVGGEIQSPILGA